MEDTCRRDIKRTGDRIRPRRIADLIVLALFIAPLMSTSAALAQTRGIFIPTGNMTTPRSGHAATLLPNGKVLITGGGQSTSLSSPELVLASAEIYDPDTGTFASTGSMTTARRLHTATLLPDGRVLIAGGSGTGGSSASAELYDPSAGAFTATGDMITGRNGHTAILLNNGKVLIVGGYRSGGVAGAELYDPATGSFTATGAYAGTGGCDFCPPATLLPDGKVLFAGQYPAQLYDPLTGAFSLTGKMISDHSTATLLTNGKVLFAGGEDVGRSSSAELYDLATGTFASTGNMGRPRVWHTLTLLRDGIGLDRRG